MISGTKKNLSNILRIRLRCWPTGSLLVRNRFRRPFRLLEKDNFNLRLLSDWFNAKPHTQRPSPVTWCPKGAVVFTLAKEVTGGSLRTIEFARKHKKPCGNISQSGNYKPEEALQRFVQEHGIKVLNVAGSRESKEPGIWLWVCQIIEDSFFWSKVHPNMLGGHGEG